MMTEYIGMVAATLTTLCFVPQAIRTLRTRDTHAISAWMYAVFSLGVSCWLIYGILLDNMPMIFANSITLPLALTILVVKLMEKPTTSMDTHHHAKPDDFSSCAEDLPEPPLH